VIRAEPRSGGDFAARHLRRGTERDCASVHRHHPGGEVDEFLFRELPARFVVDVAGRVILMDQRDRPRSMSARGWKNTLMTPGPL